jgi:hypothetical protein
LSFDVVCREKPKSEGLVLPRYSDFAGMMRPGHYQSTNFETSGKITFTVAAVGRPPHFSSQLKSAALCRAAATPVLLAPHSF